MMPDHAVVTKPFWRENGASAMRIECEDCGPLWESGPDTPYNPDDQFASVTKAHHEQMKVQDGAHTREEAREAKKKAAENIKQEVILDAAITSATPVAKFSKKTPPVTPAESPPCAPDAASESQML